MSEEELKQFQKVFINICNDAWRLIKKYSKPIEDEEYWEQCDRDARELLKKYDTPCTENIVAGAILEIDRIFKETRTKE